MPNNNQVGKPPEYFDCNFTYHLPIRGQPERSRAIRAKAKELALLMNEGCPAGREESLAMMNLAQAVFWAIEALETAEQ
jgi:hypothetical protein